MTVVTRRRYQNLNVAVAGIPKTIDNDVDIIDRSFGFLTAVEVLHILRHIFFFVYHGDRRSPTLRRDH